MNQNEAPAGTLAVIGHPANDIRIIKVGERWRYVKTGDLVDPEDFRAGWDTLSGLVVDGQFKEHDDLPEHEVNLRRLWLELAEKRIEHGVDWPYIVRVLSRDIDRLTGRDAHT